MFKTAFYACLRASEICNLDVDDINLDKLALVVRDGKGGKTSICYLSEEAIETLREYMAVRPDFELEGRRPLFFTDYGGRFDRKEIYRLVIYYKEKAGIKTWWCACSISPYSSLFDGSKWLRSADHPAGHEAQSYNNHNALSAFG